MTVDELRQILQDFYSREITAEEARSHLVGEGRCLSAKESLLITLSTHRDMCLMLSNAVSATEFQTMIDMVPDL